MKNIVNIGCGNQEDEAFSFICRYKKFLRGANVFLIEASQASLEDSRSIYQKSFTEDDEIHFHFLNYAITDDPDVKTVPFYSSKEEPTCGLNSLSPNHARQHSRRDTIEPIEVEALTINSLFSKLNLTCVDRLFIDTEGWDSKILLNLDMDKYFVPSIHFERSHVDGAFQPIENKGPLAIKLLEKFAQHQYTVIPHREWNMVALANFWVLPELAPKLYGETYGKEEIISHHIMTYPESLKHTIPAPGRQTTGL